MRQWLCDPKILCMNHILGEHSEIHMFVGTINKGISIQGYLDNNLLEPEQLVLRHWELLKEMISRGMKHKSPLPNIQYWRMTDLQRSITIDKESALMDLLSRCPKCKERSLQWI